MFVNSHMQTYNLCLTSIWAWLFDHFWTHPLQLNTCDKLPSSFLHTVIMTDWCTVRCWSNSAC